MHDAHDRATCGRHRQQEETQPCSPSAKRLASHQCTARQQNQQQDSRKAAQPPMQLAEALPDALAKKKNSIEQHERAGNDVHVERSSVSNREARLTTLKKQR